MPLKNTEIEFKYSASNLLLTKFKEFCESKGPLNFQIVSGYDHFYANPSAPESFYRHRVNTNENQLTFKRKTKSDNNFVREEHNVDLPLSVSEEKIKDLCNISGYKYNTSIFKHCFIYNFEYYNLVYYICYDIDLRELGRFTEIEMKEDYTWSNEDDAWSSLLSLEKLYRHLDISPSVRLNKSLYEMFRKEGT